MEFRPHAYQAHCIEKILEINKIGLFLDMGLGKTVTTLTAVRKWQKEPGQKKKTNGSIQRCFGYPRFWEAR